MARRFGIRFQRRLGQHFLADRSTLERVVAALEVGEDDRVVEVGPGLGALTQALASRAQAVVGIEIDPACVRALGLTLKGVPRVRIVEGDVLAQEVGRMLAPPYRVAGNIPYNLTGALLVHLLEQRPPPRRIDVVVQREVAERVAAPPGSWSLATLAVRVYGRAEVAFTIPREAFYPLPEVSSALLRITPEDEPALPRDELDAFFVFARPLFQARRKQLANVVAQRLGTGKAEARESLRLLGIEPSRRAETLSLGEWAALFRRLGPDWRGPGNQPGN